MESCRIPQQRIPSGNCHWVREELAQLRRINASSQREQTSPCSPPFKSSLFLLSEPQVGEDLPPSPLLPPQLCQSPRGDRFSKQRQWWVSERIQDEYNLNDGTKGSQLGEGDLAQGGTLRDGVVSLWNTPHHQHHPARSLPSGLNFCPFTLPFLGFSQKGHGGRAAHYLHAPGHGSLIDEQLQDVDGHNEHRQALGKARSWALIPAPAHVKSRHSIFSVSN